MKRYPGDKFPKIALRPDVAARHEDHIKVLSVDVDRYVKIGHRDSSMFDWVLKVFENLGLSTVKPEYLDSLSVLKTKFAIFAIQIDDIVDNKDMRNYALFKEVLKIPFDPGHIDRSKLKPKDLEYLDFTQAIWDEMLNVIQTYPQYKKYKGAFEFDVLQLLNSMEYSWFVNMYKDANNKSEGDAYVHHGMFIMIQLDLDLMCSEGFDDKELGMLRELTYISQKMGRIGNMIGTYPRELLESDMSSEAVTKFLKDHGDGLGFRVNQLFKREKRYPKFEEELVGQWEKEYQSAQKVAKYIKSIDTDRFLQEREFIEKAYETKIDSW